MSQTAKVIPGRKLSKCSLALQAQISIRACQDIAINYFAPPEIYELFSDIERQHLQQPPTNDRFLQTTNPSRWLLPINQASFQLSSTQLPRTLRIFSALNATSVARTCRFSTQSQRNIREDLRRDRADWINSMSPYLYKTRPDGVNVINIGKTW